MSRYKILNPDSKVNHAPGDNTPCDNTSRCKDFKDHYKDEVHSGSKPRHFYPKDFKGQVDFGHDKNETLHDTQEMFEYTQKEQTWRDWHAVHTIFFGELIESGFDWGKDEWPALTEEIRTRMNKKIQDRFYFREICDAPPFKFKFFLQRKLNELCTKYNYLYQIIEDDRFDPLETSQDYKKDRKVFSEYPQSQIKGTADYASNADDLEHMGKTTGNVVEMMKYYDEQYTNIDNMILRDLDVCFYSMTSGPIDSY